MNGRGRKMVELATFNSELEKNNEHHSNTPKIDTGDVWKRCEYEHESFMKMADDESFRRVCEEFYRPSQHHDCPTHSTKLREFYQDFTREILATDAVEPPEATTQHDRQPLDHDVPGCSSLDADTKGKLGSSDSECEPPELQDLEDSDDPEYRFNPSDLDDSGDEYEEPAKKVKKKGFKKCENGDNLPTPILPDHTDEGNESEEKPRKRKVERCNESDKTSRKKTRRVDEWLQTQAKKKRNAGEAYWSTFAKRHMPGKALKAGCGDKCKFQCSQKISEEQRKEIFSRFWQIGDLQAQREFVRGSISEIPAALPIPPSLRKRSLNVAFYFMLGDCKVRVCKLFFTATLGISHRWITTIREKTSEGILLPDKRGHHSNRKHKVDPSILEDMRAHINSIPRIESHYLRAQTTREYIPGNKTISGIYRDYVENCKDSGRPYGSEDRFRRLFDFEFNLSFFIPKKDQCDFCAAYDNLIGQDKERNKEAYELHQVNKNIARTQKEQDKTKTGPDVIVCTYDLQKSLEIPSGDVSKFYYKSRLSTYNFTIYELKTKQGYCNAWHEGEGNRGCIEIGTCVFKYIEAKVKDTPGDRPLHFIFYSDNCSGQQKNKYLISMYMCASLKFPRIASITHRFLVTGHTQNEGDNMHAIIEKEITSARKKGPIYLPSQYVQLMRTAKKNPPYYLIEELTHEDFIDFKSLQKHVGDNFNVNREGEKVSFSKIVDAKITKEKPFSFFYRLSFDEDYKEIIVNEKAASALNDPENPPQRKIRTSRSTAAGKSVEQGPGSIEARLKTIRDWDTRAYRGPCGIPQNTFKALMSLVNDNLIPGAYKNFFTSLTTAQNVEKKKGD